MSTVIVVGSGPSGVHLAETLLDHGHAVTMLDVGHEKPEPELPGADFDALKTTLDDPVAYFLGADGSGVVFPEERGRYFAHPPSKDYVFRTPPAFGTEVANFEPAISFATGGLAEAWTAGSYPLNDAELADFPFGYAALAPHYATVARRIGVGAAPDDLARFSAWLDEYHEPVTPDAHTAHLLRRYAAERRFLNSELGFYMGRSRVAVLSRDADERLACNHLGRCLWGCPRRSLYSPSSTLQRLLRNGRLRYVRDQFVTHFKYEHGAITGIVAQDRAGTTREHSANLYALAAGTLCSSKIVLDSIYRQSGQINELTGLMDNSQALVPFVSLSRLGQSATTHAYQFHQLALGIEQPRPEEYVHGQITTLKAAAVHPIAQSLPFDLRSALKVFREAHAALGAANVWLHDRRSDGNVLTIRPRPGCTDTALVLRCSGVDPERFRAPLRTLKRALRRVGCFVPPGMLKILPRGSSIHYAGTLPMTQQPCAFACTSDCRNHDFRNLYHADGASFPFLPAKNLTFTLMANAIRVADAMHRDLEGRQ